MAKSSADDAELRRACAAAVAASGARGEDVAFSIRVAKGRGIFEKLGRLAKPRVLALTGQRPPLSPSSPHLCPRFGLLCCAALRGRGGLAQSTKLGSLERIRCLPQRIVQRSLVMFCFIATSTTLARTVVIWDAWIPTKPSLAPYALIHTCRWIEAIRVAYLMLLA
jgi:hypothetical protein